MRVSGSGPVWDLEHAVQMARLSKEVYNNIPYLDVSQYGYRLVRFIDEEETGTQCMVCMGPGRSYVIVFRGSSTVKDACSDILAMKERFTPLKKFLFSPKVHLGFQNAWDSVRERVFEVVNRASAGMPVRLNITGHSLGAGLATLAAADFAKNSQHDIVLYNFGSPRVGNIHFKKAFSKLVPNCFRVVNDEDVVATIPKIGYFHIGTLVYLNGRGDLKVAPKIAEQVFENFDDLLGMMTGKFITDHCRDKYLSILEDNLESGVSQTGPYTKGRDYSF
jgi:hypothetical protein